MSEVDVNPLKTEYFSCDVSSALAIPKHEESPQNPDSKHAYRKKSRIRKTLMKMIICTWRNLQCPPSDDLVFCDAFDKV
jgi:hypothetical protein